MTSEPRLKVRDIAWLGILAALMIGGQVALAAIPNFEIVSLITIVGTLVFGWKMLFSVYVFVIAEGLIWGFGTWFWGYTYMWALLVAITMVFRRERGRVVWAAISGAYGLLFGFFYEVPYIFISGFRTAFAWFISGIPYDLMHGFWNFLIALAVLPSLREVMEKLRSGRIRE